MPCHTIHEDIACFQDLNDSCEGRTGMMSTLSRKMIPSKASTMRGTRRTKDAVGEFDFMPEHQADAGVCWQHEASPPCNIMPFQGILELNRICGIAEFKGSTRFFSSCLDEQDRA